MGFMAGPPLGSLLPQVFMCLNKDKNSSLSWVIIHAMASCLVSCSLMCPYT